MRYGRRGGGQRRISGAWPGNGPFRDLPPWERPGWLYGPGSCWSMGYWRGTPASGEILPNEPQSLARQKELLESQIKTLQESIQRIEKRLEEIES